MSMYNDMGWSQSEENFEKCVPNSTAVQAYLHDVAQVLEHAESTRHAETRTFLFRLDPRTYKDRPSTWSQSRVSFGT